MKIKEFNLSGTMTLDDGKDTPIPVRIAIRSGKLEMTLIVEGFAGIDSLFAGVNTIFGGEK